MGDYAVAAPLRAQPDAAVQPGALASEPTSSLEVGGWVQVSLLLLPDARVGEPVDVLTPRGFIMDDGSGGESRLRASGRDTRLNMRGTHHADAGRLSAFVEFDLFAMSGEAYRPRLRHAVVGWASIDDRVTVRFGQDWSAFADPGAYARIYNPLPLGAVFVRQPQFRVEYRPQPGLIVTGSIESAAGDVTVPTRMRPGRADALPHLALAGRLERGWGSLQIGTIVGKRSSDDVGIWGLSASGRVDLSAAGRRHLRFQTVLGRGVARYVGELGTGYEHLLRASPRAGDDTTAAERVVAANLSYEHHFSSRVSASAQASYVKGRAAIPDRAGRTESAAFVGNLVVRPARKIELAAEHMIVRRIDGGGVSASRRIVRLASRFHF
ncbi:hypothetical protein ACFOMD_01610 [Sphingoaurantiacus capsulatus]|uniref:Porin n=1 Tax=Sphingoaurantiacus capsulatus TaxID=1771310 RepID=A0ABV7X840_9SPHN